MAGRLQCLDVEAADLERAFHDLDAVALDQLVVAGDVVVVGVSCEQVRDGQALPLDELVQRPEWRPTVDEDRGPARLVGEQVRVREPLRVHAPLDQHRESLRLRAPLRGAKPTPPGQAAEGADHEPVRGEATARVAVGQEDAGLRLEPRARPVRHGPEIDGHLRPARIGKREEVVDSAPTAAARPGPADEDERVVAERLEAPAPAHPRCGRARAAGREAGRARGRAGRRRVWPRGLPRAPAPGSPRRGSSAARCGGRREARRRSAQDDRRRRENRPMRLALVAVVVLVAAAPARAGVRVVPPFDPADYADRAAIGLLVPGAGPTVTREAALAALLRGKLEHGLLGGVAEGKPLLELGAPGGPRSSSRCRRRAGARTTRATRSRSSASAGCSPRTRLGSTGSSRPPTSPRGGCGSSRATTRSRRWKRSTSGSSGTTAGGCRSRSRSSRSSSGWRFVRPRLAVRALLVVLAANLWLSPVLAVAAGIAVSVPSARARVCGDPHRVPRGDGIGRRDRRALPLRPLSVRSLLRDQQPARDDAARAVAPRRGAPRPGRRRRRRARLRHHRREPIRCRRRRDRRARGRLSRARASATGAAPDLAARRRSERRAPSCSRWSCSAWMRRPAGRATSPTPSATDPWRSSEDLADRVEFSVRRTAASLGATIVVFGSLAALIAVALKARRDGSSMPSWPAWPSRSSSTTRPRTCSGWGPRSRSHFRVTWTAAPG